VAGNETQRRAGGTRPDAARAGAAAAREFDALVVGGGHNGLCLAAYLARAGWSVAVLERRHEEGGGLNTEEPCIPGFYHNMHAQFMEFLDYMPLYRDFDLERMGARWVYPEAQCGIAFADGRAPVIIHRPDLLERTHASIARYSKADADTFCGLKRRTMEIDQILAAAVYTPPPPLPEGEMPDPFDNPLFDPILTHLGLDKACVLKSPKAIIDELFDTPELRALLYRECVEWGTPIDMEMGGIPFVMSVLWLSGIWKLIVGGTHTLAHAIVQACLREGVTFLESSDVSRILLSGGRAVGVATADGREFGARRVVASSADVQQTLLGMVGEENLSERWRRRARAFRYGPSHVLATTAWCLREAPHYRSAEIDPEIDRCFYVMVGFDGPEDTVDYIRAAYSGRLPDHAAGVWVNTLHDPTQAPAGMHSATGWFFFPPADRLSEEEWAEVRRTYNAGFLETWRRFAPNMTAENVLAERLYTPDEMDSKNKMRLGDFSNGAFAHDQLNSSRPFPEAAQYRTEIEGLYLCGASSHPGGGIHAGCGYNAYKAIAADHGLPAPLREGRIY
jgi:phytoene dehydrogenase-like protein